MCLNVVCDILCDVVWLVVAFFLCWCVVCVPLHVLLRSVCDLLCDAVCDVCNYVWFVCLNCLCVVFVVYCEVVKFVICWRVLSCVCVCVCLGVLHARVFCLKLTV